jgi:hypothetical protein
LTSIAAKDCSSAPASSRPTRFASRFRFELADAGDDEELRRLFAAITMGGDVPLRFSREPRFFAAVAVEGSFRQVVVCRDSHSGRAVGMAVRSVRQRYAGGRVTPVGYLSSLRFLPEYRGLGLLARGFRFLRELHQDGSAEFYLTSIAAGNKIAQQTLLGGRAGLPRYSLLETYRTHVLRVARRRSVRLKRAPAFGERISIRPAQAWELSELVQFWNTVGCARQFFPQCTTSDFDHEAGSYRGLCLEQMLVARRGNAIVGTCGIWDQTAFRQMRIDRYSPLLAAMRPVYNGWAAATGWPALPAAGTPWPALLAALTVMADDDIQLFGTVLDEQLQRIAGRRHTHLLLGLSQRDPLAAALARRRCVVYPTDVYLVAWDDAEELRRSLGGRAAYLELGCL